MNRKTKRNSPPPLRTTTAAILDHKFTDTGFAEWSKVLQLISPPNKKRRAVALIGQSREDSDEDDEANDGEDDDEDIEDNDHKIRLKKVQEQNDTSKQKLMKRRAMYIPNPLEQCNDSPRDAWHKWTLYRATWQKLRRNSLPLAEVVHLRRMLFNLQREKSVHEQIKQHQQQQQKLPKNRTKNSQNDDEDNIPLGTLLENKKLATTPARSSSSPPNMMKRAKQTKQTNAFYQHIVV
ncbi:hypothetical protein BD408DRAFT_418504, partial [Parasitella parasitica]